jgi:DNA ligase-1
MTPPSVPLATLVAASATAAATASRLAKREAIAACLRACAPDDVPVAVGFLAGEPRQGRIGVGWSTLAALRGAPADAPSLALADADAALAGVAAAAGKGAAGARRETLRALFARATAAEQDFLARLLVGELRQGALAGVVLDAVADAAGLPAADVRRAAMLTGDLGAVARTALAEGAAGLAPLAAALHRPVRPMLASPAEDVASALERLGGTAAFEWKIDGARVQAHASPDGVRVYTRTLKDVTDSVPEIVEALAALPLRDAILDGEAIALAPDGAPLPFQVTMRRFGRKIDVERLRAELPLAVRFFDCLLLDGEPLLDRPAHARAEALAAALPAELRVPRLVTADAAAAEAFHAEALARGHEGTMAKGLDAPYEAGRRGASWLKVKRAHTLDLVVLAAEWGHGRRQGTLSNLHLGARDPATGGWVMLGKTFKGMTDALLAWQTEALLGRAVARERHVVRVRPELVVEVAFNDLQESPQYPGGLALRFARVKGYREDKRADEADTIETVRAIHAAQGAAPKAADA